MNLFDLSGKTALVTGGNGGIGLGMAKGLAQAGASIMVIGRNAEKNHKAVADLRAYGGQADSAEVDLSLDDGGQKAVQATMARFGQIDILVNNAGINIRKPPQDFTLAEWRQVLDANLTSMFTCSQAAYPHLKKQGGKIINIGSMASIFGLPFAAPYGATKGAAVQLTKSLATAWAKDRIQVNAVLPGWIDSDLTKQARKDVPGLEERVTARTPEGRWGVPNDFAGIAVFLASPASDFVTGTAIPVDGGFSSQG